MTRSSTPRTVNDRPLNDDARHQPMGIFTPGDVSSGFHMDLRGVAGSYGPPAEAEAWLELLVARRAHIMPVTVLQLGLGAWQRSIDPTEVDAAGWATVAQHVAEWAAIDMDGHGLFPHLKPMSHTYPIPAPWHSAMAQGLGVSLFARHGMVAEAERAAASLLDPTFGLISEGPHGRRLEEYPASPFPHVLNGWIWALFGLYDLGCLDGGSAVSKTALDEFEAGVETLVAELPEYETGRGWSTYDRYPHPIANVASPFYHRLHVDMLRALARLAPLPESWRLIEDTAGRWEDALGRPATRITAVARKVGFRIVRPRRKAA